jgi:hypothetical protein
MRHKICCIWRKNRKGEIEMKHDKMFMFGLSALALAMGIVLAGCPNPAGGGDESVPPPQAAADTGVVSNTFTSVTGDNTLVITLTGGTFVPSPLISQFSISTPGTPGFSSLSGGIVTRTSDTEVTINGLTPVSGAGSGQKITVAAAAQANRATSVRVSASTTYKINIGTMTYAEWTGMGRPVINDGMCGTINNMSGALSSALSSEGTFYWWTVSEIQSCLGSNPMGVPPDSVASWAALLIGTGHDLVISRTDPDVYIVWD